jgi:hypothetical protein
MGIVKTYKPKQQNVVKLKTFLTSLYNKKVKN